MIIELPHTTQIYINEDTRATSGTQVITGVGYKPIGISLSAMDATNALNYSMGYGSAGSNYCQFIGFGGTLIFSNATVSMVVYIDGANNILGAVTSLDDDGFTISWTLTGIVSMSFRYMCIR